MFKTRGVKGRLNNVKKTALLASDHKATITVCINVLVSSDALLFARYNPVSTLPHTQNSTRVLDKDIDQHKSECSYEGC